jgi:hypothetical protein
MSAYDTSMLTEVKEMLWTIHPIECDYVGEAVVEEVAAGRTQFEDFSGGRRSDQNIFIELLKASVPVLVALIQYLAQAKKDAAHGVGKVTEPQRESVIVLIQNATSMTPDAKVQLIAIANDPLQGAPTRRS